MNSKRIYDAIVDRRRGVAPVGYSEKHHVVPRCVGGSNDSTNVVRLTAREHFLAHRLLTRIYPNEPRLKLAARYMAWMDRKKRRGYRVTGRAYELIRIEGARAHSQIRRGIPHTAEHAAAISAARKGHGGPVKKGSSLTPEWRAKIGASMKGKATALGRIVTDEHRARISAAKKGKPFTEAHKAALRLARNRKAS
jgi:hypothetical protein